MRKFLLFLVALPLFASQETVLEAYGDSLTAGYYANTNVTSAPSLPVISQILSDLASYIVTLDPKYILPYERRDLAWPTLLARKYRSFENGLGVENYGVGGARSEGLFEQVRRAPEISRDRVAYFFMGHNDVAHATDADAMIAKFGISFRQALKEWDKRHENSVAYLVPLGNIPRAFEVLENYVWFTSKSGARYRCEDSWNHLFPYGRTFARLHQQGVLRKTVDPLLNRMNDDLERMSLEGLGSSNRVEFLRNARPANFTPDLFAIDCYHLSEKGQQFIADTIFQNLEQGESR